MQEINSLNVLSVLDRLWIEYKQSWENTYSLLEGWEETHWRKVNTKENYVNDFSKKWRAIWSPYAFVKSYLGYTDKETFEWFRQNFFIKNKMKSKKLRKLVNQSSKSNNNIESFEDLNDVTDYLRDNRNISKNNFMLAASWWIVSLGDNSSIQFRMKDLNWDTTGYQIREPLNKESAKSKVNKWWEVGYFYLNKINLDKPVIIAEWEIDWLNICHIPNVIWTQWIQSLKWLIENLDQLWCKEIYLLIDNDEPANKAISKIISYELQTAIYDSRNCFEWFKDVNEYYMSWECISIEEIISNKTELKSDLKLIFMVWMWNWWVAKRNHEKIAEHLRNTWKFIFIQENYFCFSDVKWVWRIVKKNLIKKMIMDFMKWELDVKCVKDQDLNLIENFLRLHCAADDVDLNHSYQENFNIHFQDRIYDLKKKSFKDYVDSDFILHRLPFSSSMLDNKSQPKLRLQFLDEIFEVQEDKEWVIAFLQEYIGLLLIPNVSFEKWLLFHWSWANGKWTIMHVVEQLLWEDNISHVGLHQMKDEQSTILLHWKLANLETELEHSVRLDSSYIKKIVSWEPITWKEVFVKKLTFRPYCRLLIATNVLPYLKHYDQSILRRFVFIHLKQNFIGEKKDWELKAKLSNEIHEIFVRALEWLKRLIERKDFHVPWALENEMLKYVQSHDSVKQYLSSEDVTNDENYKCSSRKLYAWYKSYCLGFWFKPIASNVLWTRMRQLWYESYNDWKERWYLWIDVLQR